MKFMMMIKANAESEAGVMPSEELLVSMGKYNEQLVKAGVLLDGGGLHPTSRGVQITLNGSKRTVLDGPFSESKELIAGFWMIQVKSKEEAVEWAKRVPCAEGTETRLELRQLFEPSDFTNAPPELVEQEKRFRAAAGRS
jgi:hypothetical protein